MSLMLRLNFKLIATSANQSLPLSAEYLNYNDCNSLNARVSLCVCNARRALLQCECYIVSYVLAKLSLSYPLSVCVCE